VPLFGHRRSHFARRVSMAEPFGEEIMTNLLGGPSLCAFCRTIVACVIVLCWGCPSVAHPLDSLSREEIAAAVAVLREAGHIDATTRFALIDLDEPRKADVLAWKPAGPFVQVRRAVAWVYRNEQRRDVAKRVEVRDLSERARCGSDCRFAAVRQIRRSRGHSGHKPRRSDPRR
jgi:Cu2+-containing amine oxidase